MPRPVFLVGSMPFEPSEVFERSSSSLRGLLARIPDGELKGWLPARDFQRMAHVTRGHGQSISGPPFLETVRAELGVEPKSLSFNTLHYFAHAVESFDTFRRMKAEGRIAENVRFQISIPTPFTGLISWDWDQLRDVWPVYEAALIGEVAKISATLPLSELAISWDVCEFVMALANPHAPAAYSLDELASGVSRCLNSVPPPAETGLHLCYGGYNSAGTNDDPLNRHIKDTALMVEFFHAVSSRTIRPINWLHVPVPRQREDDAFFAPLANLALAPDTQLFLGLVYLEDGIEGARRKVAAASKYVQEFGVAAACGLNNPGASSRARTGEMLGQHRVVAEAL
jgi:hypothetical protein